MSATSWGETVRCSVPKTSNIAATCSRAARYLYMSDGTVDIGRWTRTQPVDGLEDATMIWAECSQHRRSAGFARMIRPRPWDYSYIWDASAHGTVYGYGRRFPDTGGRGPAYVEGSR